MDITQQLIDDCSPYISLLVYDIDERVLFVELMDNPEDMNPVLRVVFPDILEFEEVSQLDTPEDDCIDDIMSIHRIETDRILITTYKKEMTIRLENDPFVEIIDAETTSAETTTH